MARAGRCPPTIDGLLSDETLAARFNVDAADVARVRANIAAGHSPGRGIDTPVDERHLEDPGALAGVSDPSEHSAALSGAYVRSGETPAVAATPTVDIAAAMPRFTVTTASGETYGGLTFRAAMEQRARSGGTHSAEP